MLGLLAALLLATDPSPGDASSPGTPAPPSASGSLLRSASVLRSTGAPNVARMTDGKAPIDGDTWDSPHTAVLAPGGEVVWDLTSVRHVGALRLQADNNDTYSVSASADGEHWMPVWAAKPVGVPGMQTRTSEALAFSARYLRLTAAGGDNLFSVGELEAFETPEAMAATVVQRITPPPPPPPPPINTALLLVLLVAGYGAWLLNDARRINQARAAAAATPGGPSASGGRPPASPSQP